MINPEDLIPTLGRDCLPKELRQSIDDLWDRVEQSKKEGSSKKSKVKISRTLDPKRLKIEFEDIELKLPPRV